MKKTDPEKNKDMSSPAGASGEEEVSSHEEKSELIANRRAKLVFGDNILNGGDFLDHSGDPWTPPGVLSKIVPDATSQVHRFPDVECLARQIFEYVNPCLFWKGLDNLAVN